MIVTLPDNPTGTLAGPDSVRQLCAVAERHDLLIISDEIYRDLTHDVAVPFLSPAEVAPERTVITAGPSKNLALGGWRLGVARLPDDAYRLRAVRDRLRTRWQPRRRRQRANHRNHGCHRRGN